MAILTLAESHRFEYAKNVDLPALAHDIESHLFSDTAYHVVKGFIDLDTVKRLRRFYAEDNAAAFHAHRNAMTPFHGQSLITYYPKGPFPVPAAVLSLYEQISVLRNMVYAKQKFYLDYCQRFQLDSSDPRAVYAQQVYHTWFRVSWYKDRDGQYAHYDNYGEIAAFLMLTKKGEHWKKGGLHLYDELGAATVDLDALCDPGDLLWVDQHRAIHAVEPITQAKPGRLLIYVPIIPVSYMEPWYTFENRPWKIYYSTGHVGIAERMKARAANALRNVIGRRKVHYSRREFLHTRPELT